MRLAAALCKQSAGAGMFFDNLGCGQLSLARGQEGRKGGKSEPPRPLHPALSAKRRDKLQEAGRSLSQSAFFAFIRLLTAGRSPGRISAARLFPAFPAISRLSVAGREETQGWRIENGLVGEGAALDGGRGPQTAVRPPLLAFARLRPPFWGRGGGQEGEDGR
jgi:hypothetical protein